MFTTPMLLDAARKASRIPSDYRLARVLGVGDSALYKYRHEGRTPKEEHAIHLAELAGLDVGFVLLCMCMERAKTPEHKAEIFYSLRRYAAHIGLHDLLILPGPQMGLYEPEARMAAAISRDLQLDAEGLPAIHRRR
jgi:transcriptional regulator with XRE-family HTH domain